ncbi:MAG: glutamine synthetase family protein [Gammaproteobacteria bacterium]
MDLFKPNSEFAQIIMQLESEGTETVSIVGSDLHGYARGKQVTADAFRNNPLNPIHLSTLITMLDCGNYPIEPPPDSESWWPGWANGYPDSKAVVDPQTFRHIPWQENTALAICDFESVTIDNSLDFLPRMVLKKLDAACRDAGFEPRIGFELESTLFHQPRNGATKQHYESLVPLWEGLEAYVLTTLGKHYDTLNFLVANLREFGLALESWHSEAGPGQIEFTLQPQSPRKLGDDAFLFKHALKELAAQKGLVASFMGQVFSGGFANGAHLNMSLWENDNNLFFDVDAPSKVSPIMRQAAAGLLATLEEFAVLYAPTPNSHRRYKPYQWTGTQRAWGIDNKSTALRAVTHCANSTRLEHRAGSADANPYILISACLAGMLYGIDNNLEAPEPVAGDAYANDSVQSLSDDFEQSLRRFTESEIARRYFGDDFVRFYAHSRAAEWSLYQQNVGSKLSDEVSEWEFRRYFELT